MQPAVVAGKRFHRVAEGMAQVEQRAWATGNGLALVEPNDLCLHRTALAHDFGGGGGLQRHQCGERAIGQTLEESHIAQHAVLDDLGRTGRQLAAR